ncbi:MAG: hypothetical protein ABIC39_06235 [Pseudomonadota bacterium]
MSKRILVITDLMDSLWADEALKEGNSGNSFDILTLGINGEILSRINKDKYKKIPAFRFININDYADQAQDRIRKFIPAFIYEFPRKEFAPGRSLINLLRISNRINLWWFMEMSEKGALRTPFIKRLYFFELIRNVILRNDYDEIWADLNDDVLAKSLIVNKNGLAKLIDISKIRRSPQFFGGLLFWKKSSLNMIRAEAGYLIRWLLLKVTGILRTSKIPEKAVLFFSFFPYFWIKSSRSGYVESFFRSVPAHIAKRAPVRYAVWLTLGGLSKIWKEAGKIKKSIKEAKLVLLESYLRPIDFAYVLYLTIRYLFKIITYRCSIRPRIKVSYEGYNITDLVIAEFDHSLISRQVFHCFFIMRAIRRMVSKNAISALLYRIEFQPFERAIEYGVGDRCMTVAFQHSAIGRNDLQYFFHPDDFNDLPRPDKLLVTGEYPYEVLRKAGFPEDDIGICGPVRYASLIEYRRGARNRSEIRKKHGFNDKQHIFLIASPSAKEDMLNLMLSLLQVLRKNDKDFIFLFKSHPVFKFDQDIIELINQFYPNMKYSFLPDNVNLNDYLFLSDALILTGTTVGIEAICLGTMPILFENNSTFSLNPLLEIKNSYFSVKNELELKEALFSVINNDPRVLGIKKHWPEAIRKLFYNIEEDPNEKFYSVLQKFGREEANQ